MKFKIGELLYPSKKYGVVGRVPSRETGNTKNYQHVHGGAVGVFLEYVSAPDHKSLLVILVEGEQMLFTKGSWRRQDAKCR